MVTKASLVRTVNVVVALTIYFRAVIRKKIVELPTGTEPTRTGVVMIAPLAKMAAGMRPAMIICFARLDRKVYLHILKVDLLRLHRSYDSVSSSGSDSSRGLGRKSLTSAAASSSVVASEGRTVASCCRGKGMIWGVRNVAACGATWSVSVGLLADTGESSEVSSSLANRMPLYLKA